MLTDDERIMECFNCKRLKDCDIDEDKAEDENRSCTRKLPIFFDDKNLARYKND